MARFEGVLFSGPVVVLDGANRGVGVVPDVVAAGRLIEAGRGVSWAMQVRPGVVAVDVDVSSRRLAEYVVEQIMQWAALRGVWATWRPSGGGRGRMHVIVAAGGLEEQLRDYVAAVRMDARLSTPQVDLRRTIRPFTAPHRRTGQVTLPEGLDLADLGRIEQAVAAAEQRQRVLRSAPVPVVGSGGGWRGSRQDLIEVVRRVRPSWRDTSRSGIEFCQAVRLRRRGVDADTAYQVIAQPGSKAAERGRYWWQRYVWDRIRTGTAKPVVGGARTFDLARTALPTIEANRSRYQDLDPRRRHGIEALILVMCEKLQHRDPAEWVPISERDLELCTGRSRRTIRAILGDLQRLGIVERQDALRVADAHQWRLGPATTVSSPIAPPIWTPPPSRWLPHTPRNAAHHLTHHLRPAIGSPSLSTRQRTYAASAHQALRQRGVLDESPDRAALAADQHSWQRRLDAITAERDAFHQAVRDARQYHLCQRARADHHRHATWWASLPPTDQARRRHHWRQAFVNLTPLDQARRRTLLAHRRALTRNQPALAMNIACSTSWSRELNGRKMKPMDYQIWHQAPGPNDEGTTVRLDRVGSEADETFPSDVVKNPSRYGAEYDSTRRQLQQARGNPDAQIQVWRAVPHGIDVINPGDWVAISPEYAHREAAEEGTQVITAQVKASDLWSEGLLEEWGYQGPASIHGHSATHGPRLLAAGFPSPATDAVRSNPTRAVTAVSRYTSPARTCNVER